MWFIHAAQGRGWLGPMGGLCRQESQAVGGGCIGVDEVDRFCA